MSVLLVVVESLKVAPTLIPRNESVAERPKVALFSMVSDLVVEPPMVTVTLSVPPSQLE